MVHTVNNKVVVITGGAQGIGFATVDLFLQKGAKVVIILDIDEKVGNDAVSNLNSKYGAKKAEFIKCDITTDLELVSKRVFETHKTVDILMNCAGIADEFNCKRVIDINVIALIEFSTKFLVHMSKETGGKGGIIINVASIYGFRVLQYGPIYQASKFAVMGFTKSLGHPYNYNKRGVRVVAVCPGLTETKLTAYVKVSEDEEKQKDWEEYAQQQIWQKADSVAKAVVEIVEKADSGTAWLIEGGKPIVQV